MKNPRQPGGAVTGPSSTRPSGLVHRVARPMAMAMLLLTSCSARGPDQRHAHDPRSAKPSYPPILIEDPLGRGMGIQVQPWYLKPGDLDRIAATGFSVVRWGVAWDRVEKVAGVYDWREMDRFVAALSKAGLRSVVILGYGNRLYTGSDWFSLATLSTQLVEARAPATATARDAFTRFAAAAAARYRDRPITWEIWNEPDNAAFWRPNPDPVAYAALARQTCTAIRAVAPHATILGGAGAAMPNAVSWHQNIYSALMQNGAVGCLDGLSGHAYRMSSGYREPDPESIEDDNNSSRTYLYSTLRVPPRKRYVITEWGFTTYNVSADLQAAYLIRGNLTNAATGIPLTIWYEWRDSRPGADNPESGFGLLTTQGDQKNTHDALAILSRIAHARFVRQLKTDVADARVFLLERDGKSFLVAWKQTSDERARARLYVNGTYRSDLSFMPSIVETPGSSAMSIHIG